MGYIFEPSFKKPEKKVKYPKLKTFGDTVLSKTDFSDTCNFDDQDINNKCNVCKWYYLSVGCAYGVINEK